MSTMGEIYDSASEKIFSHAYITGFNIFRDQ